MKERFGHLLGHRAAVGRTLSHRLALGHCSLATAGVGGGFWLSSGRRVLISLGGCLLFTGSSVPKSYPHPRCASFT